MGESLVINGKEYGCPIYVTLDMVGGKWKVAILWHLAEGTTRFGELKRQLGAVTQKMLTQQLRELEKDGLVHRMVYAEVPPRVEYSLTTDGQSMLPVLQSMFDWGKNWVITKNSGLSLTI